MGRLEPLLELSSKPFIPPQVGLLALLNLSSWQRTECIDYILCAEASCVHTRKALLTMHFLFILPQKE